MKKISLLFAVMLIAVLGTVFLVGCGDTSAGDGKTDNGGNKTENSGGSTTVTDIKDLTNDTKPDSVVSQQVDNETWDKGIETLQNIFDINYFYSEDNDTDLTSYTFASKIWYEYDKTNPLFNDPEYGLDFTYTEITKYGKDTVSYTFSQSNGDDNFITTSTIKKENGKWAYVGKENDLSGGLLEPERELTFPETDYTKFTYDSTQKAYVAKDLHLGGEFGYDCDISVKFLNNIPIYICAIMKVDIDMDNDLFADYYYVISLYNFNKTTVEMPAEN